MNASNKDHYQTSISLSIIFTLLIHYGIFSGININSTYHVAIGIGILIILTLAINEILRRLY